MKYRPIYLLLSCLFFACQNEPVAVDYSHIPEVFTVEITNPAGTTLNHSFLPLPGNLGHLNEATDVLVIAEQLANGAELSVRPIAALMLEENGQAKQVIIASPLDSLLQLSTTTNFSDFITKNAGEKQIIQDWFLYEKGLGKVALVGWENEKYALGLVKSTVQ
ncbi:MAG: inorganic diphosphatase [Saprospiraceae bacterium]